MYKSEWQINQAQSGIILSLPGTLHKFNELEGWEKGWSKTGIDFGTRGEKSQTHKFYSNVKQGEAAAFQLHSSLLC